MKQLTASYDRGPVDVPLLDETIGMAFERIASLNADREALIVRHQGVRLTYEELNRHSTKLASAMVRRGIDKGDRVGIWAHNCAEWLIVQLATAKVGVVLVNINPAYRTHELEYALNKVACRALIMMTRFKSSDYLGMLRELLPELESCEAGELRSKKVPELRTVIHLGDERHRGLMTFAEFCEVGYEKDERLIERMEQLQPDDPINIQFTSGTTGQPKGATLTHRNILNNGYFVGQAMKLSSADRLCVPVPLYHCFGMVLGNLAALTHGAALIYPSEGFDPLAVLQSVQDERCTGLHGVPTMFIAELEHPRFADFDLSSLRTGIMAGSPCPIEVMRKVVTAMHLSEITIAYGMTETSPVSCQSAATTPLELRVSTVGVVQPHVEVQIVKPDTAEVVPIGTAGELCTRGYSVMQGYWGDQERTAEAIDAAGWMHTGDLATMDAQGYVNIVGRIKDMLIRGGENVYPREVEEFLYAHPAISDVQVVGVPDDRFGEEICAWVRLKEGSTLTEEELMMFCKGRIAHYKVPRYIRFVREFPMTVTGKVQKFVIRELMKKELGIQEVETA